MPALQIAIAALNEQVSRIRTADAMLPGPGELTPVLGPRSGQYAAVAPVAQVLDEAPVVFTRLRDELSQLLDDCATAFADVARIFEEAEYAASSEVSRAMSAVEIAVVIDEQRSASAAPAAAPAPAAQPTSSGTTAGQDGW